MGHQVRWCRSSRRDNAPSCWSSSRWRNGALRWLGPAVVVGSWGQELFIARRISRGRLGATWRPCTLNGRIFVDAECWRVGLFKLISRLVDGRFHGYLLMMVDELILGLSVLFFHFFLVGWLLCQLLGQWMNSSDEGNTSSQSQVSWLHHFKICGITWNHMELQDVADHSW